MRLLCLGTGPFAVPTFEHLVAGPHEVVGLVTRPAPVSTRRRSKAPPNPMRTAAEKLGVSVSDPVSINDDEGLACLQQANADLLVVCDYGQILSNQALGMARLGGINLHGSLLPKYRGAAPVHWAILNGDSETGVSVIHMTPRLDGGPILVQQATEIRDETQLELEHRLAQMGVGAVEQALTMLAGWDGETCLGVEQDPAKVTKAPRLNKSQGAIVWSQPAVQIERQIRAFQPWPLSYTWLHVDDPTPRRLVIEKARVVAGSAGDGFQPGQVVQADQESFTIRTGDGGLEILRLQPSGGKSMETASFLLGNRVNVGDRCGTPDQ